MTPRPDSRENVILQASQFRFFGSSIPSARHQLPFQGTVFSPDKATLGGCHLIPLCNGWMLQKKPSQHRPAGAWPWTDPAWAHWAALTSWQRGVRSCLDPPCPPSAVCGDSPLVPRKVVIFGPSVIKIVPRFPAKQQLRNTGAPSKVCKK